MMMRGGSRVSLVRVTSVMSPHVVSSDNNFTHGLLGAFFTLNYFLLLFLPHGQLEYQYITKNSNLNFHSPPPA